MNAAIKINAHFTDVLNRITKFYLNFRLLLWHKSLLHIFFSKFMKVDFKPLESVKEAADGTIYTRTAAHPERLWGPLGDP